MYCKVICSRKFTISKAHIFALLVINRNERLQQKAGKVSVFSKLLWVLLFEDF